MRYHTTKVWNFYACGCSCLSLPYLWHNFTFSFMSLGLSFKIQILSEDIIAYFIRFNSPIWTLKSDIIRRIYELFDAHGRSCLLLPYLWHNFTFSFMFFSLSFIIPILLDHIIAFFLSFTSMTSKIRYHTRIYWAFWCIWSLLSLTSLFGTQLYFFVHVSSLEFQNSDFVIPYHSLLR